MNENWNETVRLIALGILLPLLLFALVVTLSVGNHADSGGTRPPAVAVPTKPEQPSLDMPGSGLSVTVLMAGQEVGMDVEEYLVGVVLAEMPASFEQEALRAQAVAARTYALQRCLVSGRHEENAICTDYTCCQAYLSPQDYLTSGGTAESVERVIRAVADTAGLVMEYEGSLIMATYFSCSGGQTEDAVAVWGQNIPYLQSVVSPGEEDTVFYTDSKTFTSAEFQQALGVRLKGAPTSWLGKTTYTGGGGVDTMEIGGVVYRGTTLRTLLQLRSTAFAIAVSGDVLTVKTWGYGHRVGMSQYGANAMAKAGKTYCEILSYYYTGVNVVDITTSFR